MSKKNKVEAQAPEENVAGNAYATNAPEGGENMPATEAPSAEHQVAASPLNADAAEDAGENQHVASTELAVSAPDESGTDAAAEQDKEEVDATQTSVLEEIARRAMRDGGLECVYVTSDGTAFYARHDAHNHARNLSDDTILAIEPQGTIEDHE